MFSLSNKSADFSHYLVKWRRNADTSQPVLNHARTPLGDCIPKFCYESAPFPPETMVEVCSKLEFRGVTFLTECAVITGFASSAPVLGIIKAIVKNPLNGEWHLCLERLAVRDFDRSCSCYVVEETSESLGFLNCSMLYFFRPYDIYVVGGRKMVTLDCRLF